MAQPVFGRHAAGLFVVAGPADDDSLVVDVMAPSGRVANLFADRVEDPVAVGVFGVPGVVADLDLALHHDLAPVPTS